MEVVFLLYHPLYHSLCTSIKFNSNKFKFNSNNSIKDMQQNDISLR